MTSLLILFVVCFLFFLCLSLCVFFSFCVISTLFYFFPLHLSAFLNLNLTKIKTHNIHY